MKQVGNILELSKNEQFYSAYIDERYWLLEGEVQVFVVEWFDADETVQRQAGRGVSLVQVAAHDEGNIEIPSFCYKDPSTGRQWRLSIKALENNTKLEIRHGASSMLKKNFLQYADIHDYDSEGGKRGHGFENCLIAFYFRQQAKEAVVIHTGEKNAQQVKSEGLSVLASGMDESGNSVFTRGSNLYKTVLYAAHKCGIIDIADEKKIVAACGGKAITVLDIARISHFICREITLDMDWYENDCGVIIAYFPTNKNTNEIIQQERHPVACYLRGSKYYYYDITTNRETLLDRKTANSLEAKAYSIRRTLPNRKITKKDIIAFVRKGIQARDIVHMVVLGKLETLGSYAFNKCSDLGNVEFGPNLSLIKNSAFSNCVNLANISFSSSVPAYALSDVSSVASVSIDDNASSIGECAFSGCTNLRSITIGKNVNEIGAFAFENNSSLPSLILPVGIKSVQKNTFAGCSKLSKITLPAGLSTINANAFKDCMGLLEITVPETVTKIDEYAFSDCSNLQTIVLPMSLRTIGNRAFENCTKLTGISFSPMISSISWTCTECGNVNNESDVYCTNCGKEKKGQATTVTTKDGHVNLSIGGYAFSGCSSLSEIDLNIDTIEGYAFYGCTSIKKLKIVASSIGNNAFQGCSGLIDADLKIGGNIGNQAFSQCTSMTDLHLTASTVGNQAFQNCSLLSSVTLNVKQIGNQAFSDCGSITEIDINAEMIGNRALEKCFSLKTVKFTNPNAELGSKILLDCTIDNLYISAKAIPDNCFANTSIKNIIMTTSVERIGVSAFEGCDMITNVVMPSSITEIDNFAFKDCRRLETIVDEKNNSISIPKSVKTIGKRIFDGCESLKTLHICTTTIGEESFAWMPSLETFTVSSDVKTIKKHAFEGCVKLKIVDLKEEKDGASVEIIEDEAFKNCTSLEKFRLPATLKKMGNRIFLNCDEDVFRALVFGGTWAEWRKVDVSKAFKEWSGFRRKNLDMLDWCKNGDSYRNWQ